MVSSAYIFRSVGALYISFIFAKFIISLYLYFLKRSTLPKYLAVRASDGEAPWALITGASDGVGRQLAEELSRRGFNIILHGRNQQKLEGLANLVQSTYKGTKTRVLVADACD